MFYSNTAYIYLYSSIVVVPSFFSVSTFVFVIYSRLDRILWKSTINFEDNRDKSHIV